MLINRIYTVIHRHIRRDSHGQQGDGHAITTRPLLMKIRATHSPEGRLVEGFMHHLAQQTLFPRDPSSFSECVWTLQTYITVSPITFREGTWILRVSSLSMLLHVMPGHPEDPEAKTTATSQ